MSEEEIDPVSSMTRSTLERWAKSGKTPMNRAWAKERLAEMDAAKKNVSTGIFGTAKSRKPAASSTAATSREPGIFSKSQPEKSVGEQMADIASRTYADRAAGMEDSNPTDSAAEHKQ